MRIWTTSHFKRWNSERVRAQQNTYRKTLRALWFVRFVRSRAHLCSLCVCLYINTFPCGCPWLRAFVCALSQPQLCAIYIFYCARMVVAIATNLSTRRFCIGLPFYNLAKGTDLSTFKDSDQAIPMNEPLDNQDWVKTFVPDQQDNQLCKNSNNCAGLQITLDLTLPDPWNGAGGLTWEQVCPSAFKDKAIDPKYRFLCTEWCVLVHRAPEKLCPRCPCECARPWAKPHAFVGAPA